MGERPPERDSTQGFGRGSTQGFGRGNGRGFYSQGPLERKERYRQVEEWSDPASDGRRNDAPISSPMAHSQQSRTPPTPAPSEDRLFTDWSSIKSGTPPVIPPPQSIPIGDVLMTPEIEGMPETDQPTQQPYQPSSEQTYIGTADSVVQGNFPTTSTIHQQPMERLNVMGERRMNDMGTNTSDVVVESTGNTTRIPIVDVLLPSSLGDHVTIPHVNLSISGYE